MCASVSAGVLFLKEQASSSARTARLLDVLPH